MPYSICGFDTLLWRVIDFCSFVFQMYYPSSWTHHVVQRTLALHILVNLKFASNFFDFLESQLMCCYPYSKSADEHTNFKNFQQIQYTTDNTSLGSSLTCSPRSGVCIEATWIHSIVVHTYMRAHTIRYKYTRDAFANVVKKGNDKKKPTLYCSFLKIELPPAYNKIVAYVYISLRHAIRKRQINMYVNQISISQYLSNLSILLCRELAVRRCWWLLYHVN